MCIFSYFLLILTCCNLGILRQCLCLRISSVWLTVVFELCEANSQEAGSGEVLALEGCFSADLMLWFFGGRHFQTVLTPHVVRSNQLG